MPGEPEARAKAERERDGIPLPPTLWATLEELSGELGVAVPAHRLSAPTRRVPARLGGYRRSTELVA